MVLPTVNVEIDGQIVARTRTCSVVWCDDGSRIASTKPQLWPGEMLVERQGKIPMIVKESAVPKPEDVFRHQMVRAVFGTKPAILAKEADPVALDSLCRQLVDAQDAKALLRANGYGRQTDSLAAMVRTLLEGRDSARAVGA